MTGVVHSNMFVARSIEENLQRLAQSAKEADMPEIAFLIEVAALAAYEEARKQSFINDDWSKARAG